ncbi:MAG: glycosyltransferase [Actinomycetota bacterium]
MERRIAHVISTPVGVGGAERVLQAVVAAGTERGWRQLVLNPFGEDAPSLYPHADACASYRARRWIQMPALFRWTKRNIEQFRPQIVHAHLFHALALVAALRMRADTRRVLSHQHGNHFEMQGLRLRRHIDRFAVKRFDRVIAISRLVDGYLRDTYEYPGSKIRLIPNGWTGTPLPRHQPAFPTVVSVGNLRPEKGHAVLLEAFAEVVTALAEARLVLVGGGMLEERLRRRTKELGLESHVEFAGPVEDVWPYLAAAHVFAFPSKHEMLGVAAMEAMAAGLPVVASDVGGIPEVVEDGVTGILVPPGDRLAWANAITRLLRSSQLRDEMGRRAVASADRWHVRHTVDGYYRLYEELLERSSERVS